MEGAIRSALARRGFRAGDYTVGYQSCDASTPQSGSFEFRKCAANASAFARAEQLVAVIGPYSSYCGEIQIPILNRAPGGPLAMVSPIATHPGLTRGGRLAEPAAKGMGRASTTRRACATSPGSSPREDLQGVAQAMLAEELGLRRVFALDQRGEIGTEIDYTSPFSRAARRLGIGVAGSAAFNPEAKSYDALARRVARSGAQGVFMAGFDRSGGGGSAREGAARRLGQRAFRSWPPTRSARCPTCSSSTGPAAHGLYMSAIDVPPSARAGSPAGRRFAQRLRNV